MEQGDDVDYVVSLNNSFLLLELTWVAKVWVLFLAIKCVRVGYRVHAEKSVKQMDLSLGELFQV